MSLITEPTVKFLHNVALLQDLDSEMLSALLSMLAQRSVPNGEVIFNELDSPDALYIVERGQVVVSKHVQGNVDIVLTRFQPGDFFGEMGLFDAAPRSATAHAESDTLLWQLSRSSFESILSNHPAMAARICYRLVTVFIQRLRATNEQAREAIRWGLEATGFSPDETSVSFQRKST